MLNMHSSTNTIPNKKEIIAENRRLSEELKQRLFELSVLYELSNAISYTLNYDELLHLLIESLHVIIDYDYCASLLVTEEKNIKMVIKTNFKFGHSLLEEIKNDLLRKFNAISHQNIEISEEKGIEFKVEIGENLLKEEEKVKSSFDVPLFIRDKVVGLLNIGSLKPVDYPEETIKFLYTLANQASGAIERLQAVISAEKSKMKVMVENMTEGVIMTDEKDELIILNPAAREILSFSKNEELDTAKLSQRFKEIALFASWQILREEMNKSSIKEINLLQPFERVIRIEMTTVKEKEDKNLGTLLILRDVTQERKIDQMKSDFVSLVSHELRTPLTAIRGAMDNLLDGITGEINDYQKNSLLIINRNIDRLSRMIEDLLDISRIEANKLELKKEATNLNLLIKDIVLFLNEAASKKNITLFMDLTQDLLEVNLDSDRISQVITNLIGNAIKFTPENGVIKVISKIVDEGIQVEIIDNGVGIPSQDLEKIFDKFYQVRHPKGQKVKGTGLGLAICKGIIEKHNGRIWAESELGKGSKFSFVLPLNH